VTSPPDLSGLSRSELEALVVSLLGQVAALTAASEKLTARLAEAEAKLAAPPKRPDNSSTPPSRGHKASGPALPPKPRGPRGGHARRLHESPDALVEVRAQACPRCGHPLSPEAQKLSAVHDRIELPPIRPVVTRVRLHGGVCPCCKLPFEAPAPAGLERGSPFGRSIEALVVYLHGVHAVSYERLSRLMGEVFGLTLSEGAIAALLARGGARLCGANHWEWVFLGEQAALHTIAPSRGARVVAGLLGETRPQVWVSDFYAAQGGHAPVRQGCLAHLVRDVRFAAEAGDGVLAPKLERLLLRAIDIGRRRDGLKDSTLRAYACDLDRRLDKLLVLEPLSPEGRKLRARIRRIRANLFVFVTRRNVPATNNACERALRPSVIFRKVTNGFRSAWGGQAYAALRSVVGTGSLNGLTPFNAIKTALSGQSLFAPG
jgi:transposase